jgi:osmoprotectant transport system permease protein
MNQLADAVRWILDPEHLGGPDGIVQRTLEHLGYTVLTVAIAGLVAIPIGLFVGHTGRGRQLAVLTTGAARALPTLGLVTLFGLLLGIGLGAPVLALVILAIPSLLAGAYSGCESVPRSVIDAARAQGMSEWQILWRVEVPLGAPLLVNAMLAAYIGSGGLGRYIFLGLAIKDYPQMLAGSLLVIALAILLEGIGLLVGRAVRPQKFSTEGAPS